MDNVFMDYLKDYVDEKIDIEEIELFLSENPKFIDKYFKPIDIPLYRGVCLQNEAKLENEIGKLKSYSSNKSVACSFASSYRIDKSFTSIILLCKEGICLDINDILKDNVYSKEKEYLVFSITSKIVKKLSKEKTDLEDILSLDYFENIIKELREF